MALLNGGSALVKSSQKLVGKAREIAAHQLEADPAGHGRDLRVDRSRDSRALPYLDGLFAFAGSSDAAELA